MDTTRDRTEQMPSPARTRTIRVRVRGGRLEPVEKLTLPEGMDGMLTIPTIASTNQHVIIPPTRNLGLGSRQITREDAYDDLP